MGCRNGPNNPISQQSEQPAGQQCIAPINGRPLTFAHPSRQFAVLDQKHEEKNR
ncbi:hypothetical protein ABZ351_36400 [Streptomyces microflavus]|uniref:hypothetical protein n=1 Tax=Streptomyces microflavus TaxID=1919 RepID=UPI0033C72773